jgi:D-alanyl-D-alanine carboxypeptidase/D-alanyl-D-alanine-endopeptidase (penicillin-binding protein 4)
MPLYCRFLTVLALLPVVFLPGLAGQGSAATRAADLISHGGYAVTANGVILRSHNRDIAFAPASTIKLVTCLAALNTLGADYRFTTTFFLDNNDILYIQGSGDPYLTSNTVAVIAASLARQGLKVIRGLVLDAKAFSVGGPADGAENSPNPYDVANGALAVNFNSLPIRVQVDRSVISGEEETPLLPLMQEIGRGLAPGSYRVNPGAFPSRQKLPATLRYTGELFTAMLRRQGIPVSGGMQAGRTPAGLQPFFAYTSEKTVKDLVRSCLYYSNNFLANQLFLVCGAQRLGWPADWRKGRKAMQEFIDTTWPHCRTAITMMEGSGLSRKDRITPDAMLSVLATFKPYADLLKTKEGIPLKSGSLSGVHCYAGYFTNENGLDPFVILLNQQENTRDRILAMLQTLHAAHL